MAANTIPAAGSESVLLVTAGLQICLQFERIIEDDKLLCQFFLDPTSLNLPVRISISDPNVGTYFRKSRDFCYAVHNTRMKILKQRTENGTEL